MFRVTYLSVCVQLVINFPFPSHFKNSRVVIQKMTSFYQKMLLDQQGAKTLSTHPVDACPSSVYEFH